MAEVRKSRSYKDLEVWQVSLELVKAIYQITGKFRSSERIGSPIRLRRAAVSISFNVAEGQFQEFLKRIQTISFHCPWSRRSWKPIHYCKGDRLLDCRKFNLFIKYSGTDNEDVKKIVFR